MFLKYNASRLTIVTIVVLGGIAVSGFVEESIKSDKVSGKKSKAGNVQKANQKPVSVKEARGQARLLHDVLHSTLLIVHRKYYREDEKLPIPSSVLDDVFEEMQQNRDIKFRWISVNAEAMNIDHEPKTKFKKSCGSTFLRQKRV
jgi:hypothetical protein